MSYRGNCPEHGPHHEDVCQDCLHIRLKKEAVELAKRHDIEDRFRDEIANSGDC